MLYTEFNMEDAIAVAKEEGIAIGQENKEKEKEEAWKGGRKQERSYIKDLLTQGLSSEEILSRLES